MADEIWKYVASEAITYAQVPVGARPLSVGEDPQTGRPAVWAIVDTHAPARLATFTLVGTGQRVPADVPGEYVGTAVLRSGFVFHVWLEVPSA